MNVCLGVVCNAGIQVRLERCGLPLPRVLSIDGLLDLLAGNFATSRAKKPFDCLGHRSHEIPRRVRKDEDVERGVEAPARLFAQVASNAGLGTTITRLR